MSRENKNIPFSGPDIIDLDIKNVESVIKSGWLTHGKFTDELEELFAVTLEQNMLLLYQIVQQRFIYRALLQNLTQTMK